MQSNRLNIAVAGLGRMVFSLASKFLSHGI